MNHLLPAGLLVVMTAVVALSTSIVMPIMVVVLLVLIFLVPAFITSSLASFAFVASSLAGLPAGLFSAGLSGFTTVLIVVFAGRDAGVGVVRVAFVALVGFIDGGEIRAIVDGTVLSD